MSKNSTKRKATTLIELIVVLVMMSLFIMMVFNMFSVTFDAYTFNREMAAKMYAQTNVDNAFEMIELELMYSKSLGNIIATNTAGANTIYDATPLVIENSTITKKSTITSKYALAEQLIMTKKDKSTYPTYTPTITNVESSYLKLYEANPPASLTTTNWWAVAYDDNNYTTVSNILKISVSASPVEDASGTSKTLFTINASDILDNNVSNPATYISPLIYEKAIETEKPIKLFENPPSVGKIWYGEMIYDSIIYEKPPQDTDETTKLVLKKEIPTINREYEITLMDNVLDFNITPIGDMYEITLSYLVPGIFKGVYKKGTEQASVTVSRKFSKPF